MPKIVERVTKNPNIELTRKTAVATKPYGHRVLIEPGKKYKIKYRLKARRQDNEAILVFLGTGNKPIQNCLIFARLLIRDIILDRDEIIDIREVDSHIPIYWNKPVGTYQWESNGVVQQNS